jgi:hypothetical protein
MTLGCREDLRFSKTGVPLVQDQGENRREAYAAFEDFRR